MNEVFQDQPYDLGAIRLKPFDEVAAVKLANELVTIDPWLRLGFDALSLQAFFMAPSSSTFRYAAYHDKEPVGALSLRHPWLYGPYIEFLAVSPKLQGTGIGGVMLEWVEAKIRPTHRNLWIAVSSFNDRALTFYQRRGFRAIGLLPDLVRPGFTEILMRKLLG